MSSNACNRPWEQHYPDQNVEVVFETPLLRVLDARFDSKGVVPLHTHSHVVDHFWVLSGELVIETEDPPVQIRLGPGGYFAVPPAVAHSVRVNGGQDCRFVNLQASGTYDFVLKEQER